MAKFKTFNWGSWFTLAMCALFILGGVLVAVLGSSTQALVAGLMLAASGGYIAWNYYDAKKSQASEWVHYNGEWDFNVFCCDEMARSRWNFGVAAAFGDAIVEVAAKMQADPYLQGLTFRLLSGPFMHRGLPGLNNGVFDVNRGTITLSWPAGTSVPLALRHELAHVVIALRDNLDGNDVTHARMKELGLPW